MEHIIENLRKNIETMRGTCKNIDGAHDIAEAIRTLKELESYHHVDFSDSEHEWILTKIQDEIDGAKEYFSVFEQTQEPMFKQMAKDELRHAEFLHGYAYTQGADRDDLAALKAKISDILHKFQ